MEGKNNPDLLVKINRHYESDVAVSTLSGWYSPFKENAFVRYLFGEAQLPHDGMFVEIGGGAGIQGLLVQEILSDRYLHTDYSNALVDKAKSYGLKSMVVDGLSMPFPDKTLAGLLLVGPTTIIRNRDMRERQLEECARVLLPGGLVIMVASRLAFLRRHHCLDSKDAAKLEELGFEMLRFTSWGFIPGKYWRDWNQEIFSSLESCGAFCGMGIRRVVVARKK